MKTNNMANNSEFSQDDFRKFLSNDTINNTKDNEKATPNQKRTLGGGKMRPRTVVGNKQVNSLFQTSDPNKKKKFKKARFEPSQGEDEDKEKNAESDYRDRAAERRKGINNEYAESEEIMKRLQQAAATPFVGSGQQQHQQHQQEQAIDRRLLYEQSKYLGGDKDHTHLVKGLDFKLLEKERQKNKGEDAVQESWDDDIEELLEKQKSNEEHGGNDLQNATGERPGLDVNEDQIVTAMGKKIVKAFMDIYLTKAAEDKKMSDLPKCNKLFSPGQMYYNFDVVDPMDKGEADCGRRGPWYIPSSVIRSQADAATKIGENSIVYNSHEKATMDRLIETFKSIRERRRKAKEEMKKNKDTLALAMDNEKAENAIANSTHTDNGDDDDDVDIFDDAGRDYVAEIKPKEQTVDEPEITVENPRDVEEESDAVVGPYPEADDYSVVGPYPEVGDDDDVVAPYPEVEMLDDNSDADGQDAIGSYPGTTESPP